MIVVLSVHTYIDSYVQNYKYVSISFMQQIALLGFEILRLCILLMGKKALQKCILGTTIGSDNNTQQSTETEMEQLVTATPQHSEV